MNRKFRIRGYLIVHQQQQQQQYGICVHFSRDLFRTQTMALNRALLVVTLAFVFAMYFNFFDGDRDTFDPESIRGKRVLITGSSSGIGEELAYQYSKLGASVIVTARREGLLKKVAAKCEELGAEKVEYIVADMERPEDRQRLVTDTEKHLGGLDHLILNHDISTAGEWIGSSKNLTTLEREINVNLFASVDIASKCLQMLIDSRGNIGVMSSVLGKLGCAYWIAHVTCKFGLNGFFASLRQELRLRRTGVSVTICTIENISTERANRLSRENFPYSTPCADCPVSEGAVVIMKGVTKRINEIYDRYSAWYTVRIHDLIPAYFEDYFSNMVFAVRFGPQSG